MHLLYTIIIKTVNFLFFSFFFFLWSWWWCALSFFFSSISLEWSSFNANAPMPQVVGPVQVGLLKCKDRTRATTCHLAPIMIHFLAQSSVRPFFTILTSLSLLYLSSYCLLCSALLVAGAFKNLVTPQRSQILIRLNSLFFFFLEVGT